MPTNKRLDVCESRSVELGGRRDVELEMLRNGQVEPVPADGDRLAECDQITAQDHHDRAGGSDFHDDAYVHLTNVAIQKKDPTYDSQNGGKMGLRELKIYLLTKVGMARTNQLFCEIQLLIIRSLQVCSSPRPLLFVCAQCSSLSSAPHHAQKHVPHALLLR